MFEKSILKLAKEVIQLASSLNIKISTAESCTGGELGSLLTAVAGASLVYEYGFITYANRSKITELNVNENTLELYGAVSEETAAEMAAGAFKKSGSDIAIAITGIAGPGGGSITKPVGTVCIAMHSNNAEISCTYFFKGTRAQIRSASCRKALEIILSELEFLRK